MRIYFVFILFLSHLTFAQVSVSLSQLVFGDVNAGEDKTLTLDVINKSNSNNLEITDVNIYNPDFSYSLGTNQLAPNSSLVLSLKFKPRHNVEYNTEAIVVLSNGDELRVDLLGTGRYADSYYDGTFNKSYEDLKSALKSKLASGYTNLGYSGARDKMYSDIDNVGGKVTCVYTGRQASFTTRSGANSNSFNCEHTWPQSLFNKTEPERSDIHHLFPTDANSNSRRGSYPFGIVSSASWSEGGSKVGGGKFEPRDLQKGATARAMMYFAIRYQDYSNFIDGQESTLVNWHKAYTPSSFEITRNNKIFAYQKNRNPFVDHPEFIERINKVGATDTKPIIKSGEVSQRSVDFGNVEFGEERTYYVLNTGNQNISAITNVYLKSTNQVVQLKSFDSEAQVGESAKIVFYFHSNLFGEQRDTLVINLESQIGKTFEIPLRFFNTTSSVNKTNSKKVGTFYNQISKSIQFINNPAEFDSIEVWNSEGQLIYLNDITPTFTDIKFHGHSQGIYFVVLKSDKKVQTSKVLVY